MSIQYVASNDIKMYPSANRDHAIDPESYLNTEFNLVNYKKMSTLIGGWVSEKTINDHTYYTICLGGYVFVVGSLPSGLSNSTNIYCGIRLGTPSSGTNYTNPYLVNVSDGGTTLDVGEGSKVFQGLGFSNNIGDLSACDYKLHMLTKSGDNPLTIPSESKCKLDSSEIFNSISVSNTDYNVPISEKFKTTDLYATSITGNLTGNVSGNLTGSASKSGITTNTASKLYLVGVGHPTTDSLPLLRDILVSVTGGTLTAQTLNASKTVDGNTTTTTIDGGSIVTDNIDSESIIADNVETADLKVTSNYIQLDGYNNNKKKDLLNSLNDLSATGVYLKGVDYNNTNYNNSSATWLKVDGTSTPSKDTIPKRVETTIGSSTYNVLYGPFSGALYGSVSGNVTGNLTGNVTGDVTGKVTYNISSVSSTGGLLIHSTQSGSTSNDTTYYYNKLQYQGDNSSGVTISRDNGIVLSGQVFSGTPNAYLKITPSQITDVFGTANPTTGTSINIKGNITTRSGNISVSNGNFTASKTTSGNTTTTTIDGGSITATTVTANLTGTASNATNSVWATKVGTSSAHPAIGSSTVPVYINSNGVVSQASTYAGGTAVTLNNTSKAEDTASFYAPTSSGTNGKLLYSKGSGNAPDWLSFGTSGQVLTSGGNNTAPSWETIYAPKIPGVSGQLLISKGSETDKTPTWLSTGDDGQILKSNGSGYLPSWINPPKTLYKHQISLAPSSALYGSVKIDFYSNKSDDYNLTSLKSYLLTQQAGSQDFIYQKAVGEIWEGSGSTVHYLVVGVYCSDATSNPIYPIIWNGNSITTYNLPIYELTQLSSTQNITQLT